MTAVMRRKLINRATMIKAATAVSLVLSVAVAVLWARSYWWIDEARYVVAEAEGGQTIWSLNSDCGNCTFSDSAGRPYRPTIRGPGHLDSTRKPVSSRASGAHGARRDSGSASFEWVRPPTS